MSDGEWDVDYSTLGWSPSGEWSDGQRRAVLKFVEGKNWPDLQLESKLEGRIEELTSTMSLEGCKEMPAKLAFALDLAFSVYIDRKSRGQSTLFEPMRFLDRVQARLTIDELSLLVNYCLNRQGMLKAAKMKSLVVLPLFNEMLGRLSHGTDAEKRGIVLMLLSHLTDLDDRSGVNVNGHYNVDNVTVFNANEHDPKEELIDREMYTSLWKLQDFLRNPKLLESEKGFKTFVTCTNTVLETFSKSVSEDSTKAKHMPMNSPKYLTSTRLLKYQLSDPSFRRQVALQIAILCYFVTICQKINSDKLPIPEKLGGKKAIDIVSKLLSKAFSMIGGKKQSLKAFTHRIFKREQDWIKWKHQAKQGPHDKKATKCPKVARPTFIPKVDIADDGPPAKRRRMNDGSSFKPIELDKDGTYDMGCEELAMLWQESKVHQKGGLDYLKAPSRKFQKQWEREVEGLKEDEEDNFVDEGDSRRCDTKFSFTTMRLIRREKFDYFNACGWQSNEENFMWHLLKHIAPELDLFKEKPADLEPPPKAKPAEPKVKQEPADDVAAKEEPATKPAKRKKEASKKETSKKETSKKEASKKDDRSSRKRDRPFTTSREKGSPRQRKREGSSTKSGSRKEKGDVSLSKEDQDAIDKRRKRFATK